MIEKITEFVRRPSDSKAFEELSLEAFAFQCGEIEPLRRLAERRGATPESVTSWRDIPAVPVGAFARVELATAEPKETFRSSGTTGGERSTHRHPYPDLYRAVIDATFPRACLGTLRRPNILSLIPSRDEVPDSSLGFLADHVLTGFGGERSATAFGARGVDSRTARSWLAGRQRAGEPVVLLATSFALVQLLDGLDRLGLRFRLPPGSVLFDTGGTKGKTAEIARDELVRRVGEALGVPPPRIVREYGMTELTSHFYTDTLQGADPDRFVPPPWTRVRALDPESLEELPHGERGLLSVFDLANVGSALHVLTEDVGRTDGEGFRLDGRAPGADLRGCSLTVEELAGG